MIKRDLEPALRSAAAQYPVVTLTGPRQSGKTTLVRSVFSEYTYCNLERPDIRTLAQEDPRAFFAAHPTPLIIDEVQNVPELLSWIQVDADENPDAGRYILTGSHQFRLHHAIAQSLAGRTSVLRLLPFSIHELQQAGMPIEKNELLLQGCMPRVYHDHLNPTDAYSNYFQTYVERDVRALINIKNIRVFETFMRLLAARTGNIINFQSLANDVGVSGVTIREWISILEASYIIFTLAPYYKNFGKRLIKSAKIYFIEPGLASYLLGIENTEHVRRDPLHGSLFENLIVLEFLKHRYNQGREPQLYFWRDSSGNEVDLLYERHRELIPIEIKSATTWNSSFTKNIRWFQKNIPNSGHGSIIYAGDQSISSETYDAVQLQKLPGFLAQLDA